MIYMEKASITWTGPQHITNRNASAAWVIKLDVAFAELLDAVNSMELLCVQKKKRSVFPRATEKTRVTRKKFFVALKLGGVHVTFTENFTEATHCLGAKRGAFYCVAAKCHKLELALVGLDFSLFKGILFLSQNDTTQTH